MSLNTGRIDLLEKLLDLASIRHRVIAQNIANVNTPRYRQLAVSFEDNFARALDHGDRRAALKTKPVTVEGPGGAERADGNNVDIDIEMANLSKNTLLYRVFGQLAAAEIGQARSAVVGQ